MIDSIFSKIIKGQIPCHKVYEDDATLAFMDIEPIGPGHVLVVSKTQADIWDLPAADYQALMMTVHKVADRIKMVLKPKRVGLHVVGLHLPDHAHVHVFPFDDMEGFQHRPDPHLHNNHEALSAMAQKLAF